MNHQLSSLGVKPANDTGRVKLIEMPDFLS